MGIGIGLGLLTEPRPQHLRRHRGRGRAAGTTGSWLDFLTGIVPANVLGLQASTSEADGALSTGLSFNVLQIIVVAIAVGVAALEVGDAGRAVPRLRPLRARRRAEGPVVGHPPVADRHGRPARQRGRQYGWDALAPLGTFVVAVYVGLRARAVRAVPGAAARPRPQPARFFAGAWPAIQLAFVSRSSVGTLPVTERVTVAHLGVPRAYAGFAVPLGATTKMDGCAAIYPALAAIFVAQSSASRSASATTC